MENSGGKRRRRFPSYGRWRQTGTRQKAGRGRETKEINRWETTAGRQDRQQSLDFGDARARQTDRHSTHRESLPPGGCWQTHDSLPLEADWQIQLGGCTAIKDRLAIWMRRMDERCGGEKVGKPNAPGQKGGEADRVFASPTRFCPNRGERATAKETVIKRDATANSEKRSKQRCHGPWIVPTMEFPPCPVAGEGEGQRLTNLTVRRKGKGVCFQFQN